VTVNGIVLVAVPPEVVIAIGPVVAPAGTVAVTCESEFTAKVADTPLKVSMIAPVKPCPMMVTTVPTAPLIGVKLVMFGRTVNVAELAALPPAVVIAIFPLLAPAGEVTVTDVSEFTLMLFDATPPKVTFVVCVKLTPVIVTEVPSIPLGGIKVVICGVTRNI
jgi:hypothetical protein